MTDDNASTLAPAEPIFSARLTPHRSLSPCGYTLLMATVVALSLVAGLAFWLIGAWPVAVFALLNILLIQRAFLSNYRAAGAYDEVEVRRDWLTVRKVSASGNQREYGFNPHWARLEIVRQPDQLISRLLIASHGRRIDIAGCLGPDERESFSAAFAAALAEARDRPRQPRKNRVADGGAAG